MANSRLLAPMLRRAAKRELSVQLRTQRHVSTKNSFLRISEEVQDALNSGRPVVALETTIYTHGYPYPDNVALASHLESVVRVNGGVPATIGILDGVAHVGMAPEELIRLTASAGKDDTLKISRRDLAYACGLRLAGRNFNGGTTIAGTMLLAHLAGIKVFATGGLGGVHRGAETSMDVSADLTELGRTPVAVVSSGCKSFLDIPKTLEYLETQGVAVCTFADGRPASKVDYPGFWSRDSGTRSPMVVQNEIEAAAIIHAQFSMPVLSGIHFANPIPEAASIPKSEIDSHIADAIRQADDAGATGKANTPFILSKVKELTGSRSLVANRALIESNVRRGAIVARELAVLESSQAQTESGLLFPSPSAPVATTPDRTTVPVREALPPTPTSAAASFSDPDLPSPSVIVAGALAIDMSCDFAPNPSTTGPPPIEPQLHTSNPARISTCPGGVAFNIALAASRLLPHPSHSQLRTALALDPPGASALSHLLPSSGLRTDGVLALPASPSHSTPQYVAVNAADKSLHLAMADMRLLEDLPERDAIAHFTAGLYHTSSTTNVPSPPRCLAADANLTPTVLHAVLRAGRRAVGPAGHVLYEPVSAAKAARFFTPFQQHPPGATPVEAPIFPHHAADIATPNAHELRALHGAATARIGPGGAALTDDPRWFAVVDALGVPGSGLRAPLERAVGRELVDVGVPQMAVQLLPFFPAVIVTLGEAGVLLVRLLRRGDARLVERGSEGFVLARRAREWGGDAGEDGVDVGGLYVRVFPPPEKVPAEEVVSVNGVGDTFAGALLAELASGGEDVRKRGIEDVVQVAQRAAAMTLRARESVSPSLGRLRELL